MTGAWRRCHRLPLFPSVSKIGTGLSDTEWQEVRERCAPFVRREKPTRVESHVALSAWVEPRVVIEVLADEVTRSSLHTLSWYHFLVKEGLYGCQLTEI
jgi:ATP-dependent DNA ligase